MAIYYSRGAESESYIPDVSIIIAARNEEQNIPLLIESLINERSTD